MMLHVAETMPQKCAVDSNQPPTLQISDQTWRQLVPAGVTEFSLDVGYQACKGVSLCRMPTIETVKVSVGGPSLPLLASSAPAHAAADAAPLFFASLRRLDASGVKRIYARESPESGLGRAIMDRLRRASHE